MVFIAGEYGSTTQNMSSYDNSHVADLKYDAEDKEEIIEDMVKMILRQSRSVTSGR